MKATENPAQAKISKAKATASASKGLSEKAKTEVGRADKTGNTEILVADEAAKTLKDAVNRVVLLYSYARKGDVQAFVETFIWRPVATMAQVFGSADLKISAVEKWSSKLVKVRRKYSLLSRLMTEVSVFGANLMAGPAVATGVQAGLEASYLQGSDYVRKRYKETSYAVTAGKEGFHSRAFSDEDNLFGLVQPTVKKILGLTRSDEKLLAKMDTRREKRVAVRAYVAALMRSPGVLG